MSEDTHDWFRVLAECKVWTRQYRLGGSNYAWLEARPAEEPPSEMRLDPAWHGDHWRFANDTFHSVYDTWDSSLLCVLQLQERGFIFQPLDPTLLEAGAGI